jgi:hypothetical protein
MQTERAFVSKLSMKIKGIEYLGRVENNAVAEQVRFNPICNKNFI